jgi:hypothetical protein
VAPPASFSDPKVGVVQVQPPPGAYVGPLVMTIAARAGVPTSSHPSTASVAEIPLSGRVNVIATPPFPLR